MIFQVRKPEKARGKECLYISEQAVGSSGMRSERINSAEKWGKGNEEWAGVAFTECSEKSWQKS